MPKDEIVISGLGSASPLGRTYGEIDTFYASQATRIRPYEYAGREVPVAAAAESVEIGVSELRKCEAYRDLDRSVLLAILAAREVLASAALGVGDEGAGVSIGSSRGATALFEEYYRSFLAHPRQRTPVLSSPTTTLGNLSSWIAQDCGFSGLALSHSSTCSSAVHAVANGMAWLRAGMAKRFLCGGTEAPLTPFTIAQMQALTIYSKEPYTEYPCRPCALEERNTFVLGEGACCFLLETLEAFKNRAHAGVQPFRLESVGLGLETLSNATSISHEADAIAQAMTRALQSMHTKDEVDAIILHAPGTIQGDAAELRAVRRVFGETAPILTSNKWIIGHTLGASGALSLEYAAHMIRDNAFCPPPYKSFLSQKSPSKIRKVMVNSAGFGGNAASVIISSF